MLHGACHCGRVHWEYDLEPESATACSCSICRRYGAIWAYGHLGVDLRMTGPTRAYRRADQGDLDFHFCTDCGAVAGWTGVPPSDQGARAAVNLRLAEAHLVQDIPLRHFDGAVWKIRPSEGARVRDIWF